MNKEFFDYSLEPGKKLKDRIEYVEKEPIISVIMPFYNDKRYIRQAVFSILNQTFPYFELIIIDDGSKDEEALKELDEISKLDYRIKIFHKENEGVSIARDYGASKSSNSAQYIIFCDSDDLLESTYLECAYWTLETNKNASWAYTDSLGFDGNKYLWNKWFDARNMKKENTLTLTALIRKKDFESVNGFNIKEKYVYEDWNLWLKLIAKGKFPVRMNFYGFWYRRKQSSGEFNSAKQNKKRAMQIISETSETIKEERGAIQYPRQNYNWDIMQDEISDIIIPERKGETDNKINILMIIPWMTTGGADKFNIDLIKGLDKEKFSVTVITTEPQINNYRQEFEKYATVFDLTTFIDRKYWLAFVNYIIKSRNINFIINTNSRYGYSILPYVKGKYPEIPIIDYIHMEEWYNRNGGYSRDSSSVASILEKTLVCNKNSEKILVDYFKRDSDDIETVYIGVDEKIYDPKSISEEEKNKIIEKYDIKKHDRFIISYICRITAQKRPHLLIKIIEKLKQKRNDFIFVIAGDGDMLKSIKKEADKYKLNDNIKFIGNVKNTKEIYAISDLTINCSIKEGLALTSYESLAMGVPVISADVGGQKELINDKVGKIVPCMQEEEDIFDFMYKEEEINNYVIAINEVLNDIEGYKKECRKRILDGFTINQMQEKMANIIEEISKKKKEKIDNKEELSSHLDVCKELICYFLEESNEQFRWQCEQYNLAYYELTDEFKTTKWSKIKEKLWTYPAYRKSIRILQKLGILQGIKNFLRRQED